MAEIRTEPRIPPSVGRIVHYHFPDADVRDGGHPYAALVIAVDGDHAPGEGRAILRVVCGCSTAPGTPQGDRNVEAVWSAEPKAGCWNWPPRV